MGAKATILVRYGYGEVEGFTFDIWISHITNILYIMHIYRNMWYHIIMHTEWNDGVAFWYKLLIGKLYLTFGEAKFVCKVIHLYEFNDFFAIHTFTTCSSKYPFPFPVAFAMPIVFWMNVRGIERYVSYSHSHSHSHPHTCSHTHEYIAYQSHDIKI